MPSHVATGAANHVVLTVTDLSRSRAFYTGLLGFQEAVDLGAIVLCSNGSVILGLRRPPDAQRSP